MDKIFTFLFETKIGNFILFMILSNIVIGMVMFLDKTLSYSIMMICSVIVSVLYSIFNDHKWY